MDNSRNDLFVHSEPISEQPLAARMRPRTIDEFVGQDHILAPGRLLRRAIAADMLGSLIFSGPPGTGKTTLAHVIANTTRSAFISLNAVLGGVQQVRDAVEHAKSSRALHGRKTILFVDEVHRWNKAQQDALLPWVENGTVILIGATTENPFFEVNSALVSRSRIFQLTALTDRHLHEIVRYALSDTERGYGSYKVSISEDAIAHLVRVADGDARTLLNALQLAVETTPERFPPERDSPIHITLDIAEQSIQRKALLYDKEGDYHFDSISAFIKSMRGSDPDATLYWMARMLRSGEDPHYLFRRMLVFAGEDIGLADPQALVIAEAAARAFDRVGLPEGQFHLSQAALYLATAPKSNSTLGYFDAVKAVEDEQRRDVPRHLRDDSRDAAGFGHGDGYQYPHAYRDHWVAQAYLPHSLAGRLFYQPGNLGYEGRISYLLADRRALQLSALSSATDDEDVLTYSPSGREAESWLLRTADSTGRAEAIRDTVLKVADIKRHHRVLVYEAGGPTLLWEALRCTPEGSVVACFETTATAERATELLSHRPSSAAADPWKQNDATDDATEEMGSDDPLIVPGRPSAVLGQTFGDSTLERYGIGAGFERIVTYRLLSRIRATDGTTDSEFARAVTDEIRCIKRLSAENGRVVIAEPVPALGQRLSELVRERSGPESVVELLISAEAELFSDDRSVDTRKTTELLNAAGLAAQTPEVVEYRYDRTIPEHLIDHWFSVSSGGGYGKAIDQNTSSQKLSEISDTVKQALAGRSTRWRSTMHIYSATNR